MEGNKFMRVLIKIGICFLKNVNEVSKTTEKVAAIMTRLETNAQEVSERRKVF